ncbi:hypothetical protein B0T18DRAFT_451251, partial [Schizothecium vesticola]
YNPPSSTPLTPLPFLSSSPDFTQPASPPPLQTLIHSLPTLQSPTTPNQTAKMLPKVFLTALLAVTRVAALTVPVEARADLVARDDYEVLADEHLVARAEVDAVDVDKAKKGPEGPRKAAPKKDKKKGDKKGDKKKGDKKKGDKKGEKKVGEKKKPEAKKPEAKKPEVKKPEAKKPEAKKPEAKKPEAKKPEPKKEAPKKEAPKKEAPKKEAPKKEAPKKEAPKEAPKPKAD